MPRAYEQYEIAQAFVLIVVCAEPEKAERYYGEKGKGLYTAQNCAAHAEYAFGSAFIRLGNPLDRRV